MQRLISRFFEISQSETTIKAELMAGLTTFLTMSYIIFLNPNVLSHAGMNVQSVFVATCLVAAIGSILLGLMSNYPIAIAPGVPLAAYFAYIIVIGLGFSWQEALGSVFISGVIFLLLTVTSVRRWIIESVPHNINIGISVGIGLFIALLALKSSGVIQANPKTLVTMGNITDLKAILFFAGFLFIIVLDYFQVVGAILISILAITIVSLIIGTTQFHGVFSIPRHNMSTFFQLNLRDTIHHEGFKVIFAFLLMALFDSTGTMSGLLQQKIFVKDPRRTLRISRALFSDSVATIAGALFGTSSASPYVESASGIRAGGRTGLTAVTVGILFLLAIFFSPLAESVPSFAVAPPLLYVGVLMFKHIVDMDSQDFSEFVPGIITTIMIPFTFSITDGLGLGILSYVLIKLFCGRFKDLNVMLVILAIVFAVYFVVQPSI